MGVDPRRAATPATVRPAAPHANDPRDKTGCPHTQDGLHVWGPDPDDPDNGDTCTLCATPR